MIGWSVGHAQMMHACMLAADKMDSSGELMRTYFQLGFILRDFQRAYMV